MNKEELKNKAFTFIKEIDKEGTEWSDDTFLIADHMSDFAIEYSNTQNALLKKELEEAKAEIEMLKNYCNDLPKNKEIKCVGSVGICPAYQPDNTTGMNCRNCGKSKWHHNGLNIG